MGPTRTGQRNTDARPRTGENYSKTLLVMGVTRKILNQSFKNPPQGATAAHPPAPDVSSSTVNPRPPNSTPSGRLPSSATSDLGASSRGPADPPTLLPLYETRRSTPASAPTRSCPQVLVVCDSDNQRKKTITCGRHLHSVSDSSPTSPDSTQCSVSAHTPNMSSSTPPDIV